MSKTRPIIFSAPMVRAILDGRKTQTRRIIQSPRRNHPEFCLEDHGSGWIPFCSDDGESSNCDGMEYPIACPYGFPGDRLYVREAFTESPDGPIYRATESDAGMLEPGDEIRWKPSIHMPKRLARLWLEVTGVRVERLQDISESDAKSEGVEPAIAGQDEFDHIKTYRTGFVRLWNYLNAKRAPWDSSPWVWVIEFKVVK